MQNTEITLEKYLSAPAEGLETPDFTKGKAADIFRKLAGTLCRIPFVKKAYIKKLLSELEKCGIINHFGFKVPFRFKVRAFMHDEGYISISYGTFIRMSPASFMQILCHELAHAWLSGTPFYCDLKQTDWQFRKTFCGISDVTLVDRGAPVEMYAAAAEIRLLDSVASLTEGKTSKKIFFRARDAEKKFNVIKKALNGLQRP